MRLSLHSFSADDQLEYVFSVKYVLHERAWIKYDVFKVVCETIDKTQVLELEKMLRRDNEILSWNLPVV